MTTLAYRSLIGWILTLMLALGKASGEGQEIEAVTVTQRGEIRVERSEGRLDEPLRLVGGDFVVRRVVVSPNGAEVVILVADVTHLDWASRVFAFDPKTATLRVVYDTFADRWNGPHYLLDAAKEAGRPENRYPDNDLEDLFYDAKGVLHVVNEDNDTFALDQKAGVVVGLRLVREVALVAGPKVEETEVAGERAFRVRLPSR